MLGRKNISFYFLFGARPIFRGKLAVSFREGMIKTKKKQQHLHVKGWQDAGKITV